MANAPLLIKDGLERTQGVRRDCTMVSIELLLAAAHVPPEPKVPGFPHGMLTTHAEVINKDLLDFIRS